MADWSIDTLLKLWPAGLTGVGCLVLAAMAGGLIVGRGEGGLSRFLRWWVVDVVLPMIRSRSGVVRAVVIFVNNAVICALLVSLGRWGWLVWVGLIVEGMTLGGSAMLLSDWAESEDLWNPEQTDRGMRRVRVGFVLNMLELPAIGLSVAVGVGQSFFGSVVSSGQSWSIFAICVVPLLVLAAAGESLWIGAGPGK